MSYIIGIRLSEEVLSYSEEIGKTRHSRRRTNSLPHGEDSSKVERVFRILEKVHAAIFLRTDNPVVVGSNPTPRHFER